MGLSVQAEPVGSCPSCARRASGAVAPWLPRLVGVRKAVGVGVGLKGGRGRGAGERWNLAASAARGE